MRFAVMLLMTMAMSTLAFFTVVVVATDIQDELGISKFQLGILGGANTGMGGLIGVQAGRLCDQLGARRSMAIVLLISGATAAFMAVFTGYVMLLIGMLLAGFAQGLGNPATNKAIATGIVADRRGLMTGLKQSGVQLAVFSSGFAMPTISSNYGWRTGMWITAGISVVSLLGLGVITELDEDGATVGSADDTDRDMLRTLDDAETSRPLTELASAVPSNGLAPFVYRVGVYGFLLGAVGGGIGRFTPLFAEEAVGFTPAQAGIVFGLAGLVAIPTRIASGVMMDRGVSARITLMVLAAGGAAALLLTWLADPGPGWLLWGATILSGLTIGSWNTAANLAMVRQGANAGRATGVLVLGFMTGLTVAGPIVGKSVDVFDSYTPALIGSVALAVLAAVVLLGQSDPTEAR